MTATATPTGYQAPCGCRYGTNGGRIEACVRHPDLPGGAAYDPPAPPSPFLFVDKDTIGRGGIR